MTDVEKAYLVYLGCSDYEIEKAEKEGFPYDTGSFGMFKDGYEIGRKDAVEEIAENMNGTTSYENYKRLEELEEKSRWHYPSKGELPDDGESVYASFKKEYKDLIVYRQYVELDYTDSPDGTYHWFSAEYPDIDCTDSDILAWCYLQKSPKDN